MEEDVRRRESGKKEVFVTLSVILSFFIFNLLLIDC